MLFVKPPSPRPPRHHHHHQHQHQHQHQQQVPALPPLNEFCSAGPDRSHLPVRMRHAQDTVSHAGDPMAVYECPICGRRSGWVADRAGKGLRRLWTGWPTRT